MPSGSNSVTLYSSNGSGYRLTASVVENSTSTSANTSNITATATLTSLGVHWNSNYDSYLKIFWHDNRENKDVYLYGITAKTIETNGSISATSTLDVLHNTDGTLNGYVIATWEKGGTSSYTPNTGNVSTDWIAFTTIPRYASITTFKVDRLSETSVKVTWGASAACDAIWYSTNNGSSWTSTSGYPNFNITGLSANTTYKFKIRVRRTDSQLTTDSSVVSQTTYDYPYCTESPNFTIGNSLTLKFYNPLSRNVKVYIVANDGSQQGGDQVTGTSLTGYYNEGWQNFWYNSIPNATSGKYQVKVVYGSVTKTRSNNNTYSIRGTETPTFSDFTYRDSNSTISTLTGNDQVLVKGKSTLEVTISSINKMIANNSATEKSYNITCDTKTVSPNYSENDIVSDLGTIVNSGTKRLTVTAYDSRNLSTSVYKDITIYDYAKPVINATLTRLNNFENETTLTVNGTYNRLTIEEQDKNALQQVQYRYRETGGEWSGYTTMVTTASNGTYTCTDIVLNLDNTKSFEFEIVATDLLDSSNATTSVDIGEAIFFIGSNTKKLYYNGEEMPNRQGIIDLIYPIGSIYISINTANPSTIFGGTWEKLSGGFLYGSTNTTGQTGTTGNGTGTSTGGSTGSTGTPSNNTSGSTTLTVKQIPSHSHLMYAMANPNTGGNGIRGTFNGVEGTGLSAYSTGQNTGNAGGGEGHTHSLNNHTHSLNSHTHTIPYVSVCIWKRTA